MAKADPDAARNPRSEIPPRFARHKTMPASRTMPRISAAPSSLLLRRRRRLSALRHKLHRPLDRNAHTPRLLICPAMAVQYLLLDSLIVFEIARRIGLQTRPFGLERRNAVRAIRVALQS